MTVLNFESAVYAEDSDEQLLSKGMWHDPVTGLIWTRCSLGQKWENDTCVGEASKTTWISAMLGAEKISYAGYDDWYLPSMDDLRSLRKCSTGYHDTGYLKGQRICKYADGVTLILKYTMPAIDQLTFPNTPFSDNPYLSDSQFWSSSYEIVRGEPHPFTVGFGRSSDEKVNHKLGRVVRIVRGGNSYDEFSKSLLIAKETLGEMKEFRDKINNEKEQKRKEEDEYVQKTAAFRKSVKEGDDTTVGVVILVKGGLVKIQTNESQCSQRNYNGDCTNYINTPAEKWFKRSEIYPLR